MRRKYLTLTLWLAAAALVLLCGAVVARMFRQTDPVNNQFDTAVVDCVVHETLDSNSKTSITVENTGNIDAYIRVRFVSYWVNDNDQIIGTPSVMPSIACTGDWIAGADHTYYHRAPVQPGAFTAELLDVPMILEHNQVVEVFADAIQSLPETAAEGKWNVTIEDGVITGS